MRLLSWNILASEWIEKKYYPTISEKTLFNRKKRFHVICELLKKSEADVIMLQEVMKSEYRKLTKLMSKTHVVSGLKLMYWSYTTGPSNSGNVTMLNNKLFTGISHEALEFGIHTKCKNKGKNIDIFNIHLDDISAAKRTRQIAQAISEAGSGKVIIAGDFNHNYTPASPFYKIPGYIVHNKCPTYFIERKMTLDNIITKGFKPIKIQPCEWYPDSQECGMMYYGSDHIFVVADVSG